MWESVLTFMGVLAAAAFSAFSAVKVAKVNSNAAEEKKRREERQKAIDKREELRSERDALLADMVFASLSYNEAIAIAVQDGKLNGEMKAAKEATKSAKVAYTKFVTLQGIEKINESA